jgi:hypothetical protein
MSAQKYAAQVNAVSAQINALGHTTSLTGKERQSSSCKIKMMRPGCRRLVESKKFRSVRRTSKMKHRAFLI